MSAPMTLVELHDAIAKAVADVIGHGMREKCERHADAVLAVVGPQLLANANHLLPSGERGGVDAGDIRTTVDAAWRAAGVGAAEQASEWFSREFRDLHPATASLVWNFALALGNKLSDAERKYGYTDGWRSPDWMDECRHHLMQHIAKGDPRDVAAYCAFLWHHGASTAPTSEPVAQGATGYVPLTIVQTICNSLRQRGDYLSISAATQLERLSARPASPEQPAGRQGEAWRACYGAIIKSLAAMARVGAPDSWPEDAIRRDPIMEEVRLIKQALDTFNKAKPFPHPAAPVGVPEPMVVPYGSPSGAKDYAYGYEKGRADGWNACRDLCVAAAPSAPQEKKACTRNCDCVGPCKMGLED